MDESAITEQAAMLYSLPKNGAFSKVAATNSTDESIEELAGETKACEEAPGPVESDGEVPVPDGEESFETPMARREALMLEKPPADESAEQTADTPQEERSDEEEQDTPGEEVPFRTPAWTDKNGRVIHMLPPASPPEAHNDDAGEPASPPTVVESLAEDAQDATHFHASIVSFMRGEGLGQLSPVANVSRFIDNLKRLAARPLHDNENVDPDQETSTERELEMVHMQYADLFQIVLREHQSALLAKETGAAMRLFELRYALEDADRQRLEQSGLLGELAISGDASKEAVNKLWEDRGRLQHEFDSLKAKHGSVVAELGVLSQLHNALLRSVGEEVGAHWEAKGRNEYDGIDPSNLVASMVAEKQAARQQEEDLQRQLEASKEELAVLRQAAEQGEEAQERLTALEALQLLKDNDLKGLRGTISDLEVKLAAVVAASQKALQQKEQVLDAVLKRADRERVAAIEAAFGEKEAENQELRAALGEHPGLPWSPSVGGESWVAMREAIHEATTRLEAAVAERDQLRQELQRDRRRGDSVDSIDALLGGEEDTIARLENHVQTLQGQVDHATARRMEAQQRSLAAGEEGERLRAEGEKRRLRSSKP